MTPIEKDLLVGGPFAGLDVFELEEGDGAPDGAVCKTATQFLDDAGNPLNPPPGHEASE